jgi:hypothetical protein
MSFATFIDNEEMSFRQGVMVVLGWLALMGIVGFIVAYFSLGV